MKHLVAIALGGSLGAVARYITAKNIQSLSGQLFPLGTLFVNMMGSFLIGIAFSIFENIAVSRDLRSFLTIGFLGAFTTFSTYSLETIALLRDGELKLGISNFLLNNLLCLMMVFIGLATPKILLKIIR